MTTLREAAQMALDAFEYRYTTPEGRAAIEALRAALAQREWQGMTDEEIREFEIWLDDEEEKRGWNPPADIVKYIEAKLRRKTHDKR